MSSEGEGHESNLGFETSSEDREQLFWGVEEVVELTIEEYPLE